MTTSADLSAQELAEQGMRDIEEAVLKVLREAGHSLQPAEIATRAGLFGTPAGHPFNHLTQGILDKLERDGRIRAMGHYRRWEIIKP